MCLRDAATHNDALCNIMDDCATTESGGVVVKTLLDSLAKHTRPSALLTGLFLRKLVKRRGGLVASALPHLAQLWEGTEDEMAAVCVTMDAALADTEDEEARAACLACMAQLLAAASPEAEVPALKWLQAHLGGPRQLAQLGRGALLCSGSESLAWIRKVWESVDCTAAFVSDLSTLVVPLLMNVPGLCDSFLTAVIDQSENHSVADVVLSIGLSRFSPALATRALDVALMCMPLAKEAAVTIFTAFPDQRDFLFPLIAMLVGKAAVGSPLEEPVLSWTGHVLGKLFVQEQACHPLVLALMQKLFACAPTVVCDVLETVTDSVKGNIAFPAAFSASLIDQVMQLFTFGSSDVSILAGECMHRCCASVVEMAKHAESTRFHVEQAAVALSRSVLLPHRVLCLCLTKKLWLADGMAARGLEAVLASFTLISPAAFPKGSFEIVAQTFLLDLLASAPSGCVREKELLAAVTAKVGDPRTAGFSLQCNSQRVDYGVFAGPWLFRGLNQPDFRPLWVSGAIACLARLGKRVGIWLTGTHVWSDAGSFGDFSPTHKPAQDIPLLVAATAACANASESAGDWVGLAANLRVMAAKVPTLSPIVRVIVPVKFEVLVAALVNMPVWSNKARLAAVLQSVWTELEPMVRAWYMHAGDNLRLSAKASLYGTTRPPLTAANVYADCPLPSKSGRFEGLCVLQEGFWEVLHHTVEASLATFSSEVSSPLIVAHCLRAAFMSLCAVEHMDHSRVAACLAALTGGVPIESWIEAGLRRCNDSFFDVYWIEVLLAANWVLGKQLEEAARRLVRGCILAGVRGGLGFLAPVPVATSSPFLLYRTFEAWETFEGSKAETRVVQYEIDASAIRPTLSLHLYLLTCYTEALNPPLAEWVDVSSHIASTFATQKIFEASEVGFWYRYSLVNLLRLAEKKTDDQDGFLASLFDIVTTLAQQVLGDKAARTGNTGVQKEYFRLQHVVLRRLSAALRALSEDAEGDTTAAFDACRSLCKLCNVFVQRGDKHVSRQKRNNVQKAVDELEEIVDRF